MNPTTCRGLSHPITTHGDPMPLPPFTEDPDQQRALAIRDAYTLLRQAQAAVAAAANHEPQPAKREDLVRLHSAVVDAQDHARRLQP